MTHPDESSPPVAPTGNPVPGGPDGAFVRFTFEGRQYTGREGETVAGALFRNGVRTLSYSVKYHRPRGISCGRGRCVGCLMEIDGDPSVKTCVARLHHGMNIRRQDFRPFYSPLLTAAIRLLPFPAGFYFRFFSRPRFVQRSFLGTLRRMAGVARIDPSRGRPTSTTRDSNTVLDRLRRSYDVIVVGGGLSGLTTAQAASHEGARVLIVEEQPFLGGTTLGEPGSAARRDALIASVAADSHITVAEECTAQGYYGDGRLLVAGTSGTGHALREIHGGAVVFATGATDVIPLFENNDVPGIFGVRALRLFLERDGLVPGKKAAIFGTGAELTRAAELVRRHGIGVATIVDTSTDEPSPAATHQGGRLTRVEGGSWVCGVTFETTAGRLVVPCDLVCVAGVPQPSFELAQQAGFTFSMVTDDIEDNWVMRPTERARLDGECALFLVGAASGNNDSAGAAEDATTTGRRAAGAA